MDHVLRISSLEYGVARYEHVGTCIDETLACLEVDASINLDECL